MAPALTAGRFAAIAFLAALPVLSYNLTELPKEDRPHHQHPNRHGNRMGMDGYPGYVAVLQPSFDDEFGEKSRLNTSRWYSPKWRQVTCMPPYMHVGHCVRYCLTPDNGHLTFRKQGLVLRMDNKSVDCGKDVAYATANLRSTFFYRYGNFTIRMRVCGPQSSENCMSCFALYEHWTEDMKRESTGKIAHQEINVCITRYYSFHRILLACSAGKGGSPTIELEHYDFSQEFHTFTIEWTPQTVRWILDENIVLHRAVGKSGVDIPDRPMGWSIILRPDSYHDETVYHGDAETAIPFIRYARLNISSVYMVDSGPDSATVSLLKLITLLGASIATVILLVLVCRCCCCIYNCCCRLCQSSPRTTPIKISHERRGGQAVAVLHSSTEEETEQLVDFQTPFMHLTMEPQGD